MQKVLIAYDGLTPLDVLFEDLALSGLQLGSLDIKVVSSGEFIPTLWSSALHRADHPDESHDIHSLSSTIFGIESKQTLRTSVVANGTLTHKAFATDVVRAAKQWGADVIVLGSRSHSGFKLLLSKDPSPQILREASCSVRLVRRLQQDSITKILFAFDGSAAAWSALRRLATYEWPQDIWIHIVTAVDFGVLNTPHILPEVWLEGCRIGGLRLQDMLAFVMDELVKKTNNITSAVLVGSPYKVIMEEAKRIDADTIVLGSRKHTAFERVVLGSTAQSVAMHATSNVEVIPER